MILVNVSRSAVSAVTDAQLAESARGYWKVSEETIRNYGDHLAAVRDNVIVGIWRIGPRRRQPRQAVALSAGHRTQPQTYGGGGRGLARRGTDRRPAHGPLPRAGPPRITR